MAERIDQKTQEALQAIQMILRNPLLPRTQAVEQIRQIVGTVNSLSGVMNNIRGMLSGNISSLSGLLGNIGNAVNGATPAQSKPVIGSHEWQAKLAPHVGSIKNVKIVSSGAKRGDTRIVSSNDSSRSTTKTDPMAGMVGGSSSGYATGGSSFGLGGFNAPVNPIAPTPVSRTGLTVLRSGAVSGEYSGGDLTITVEGGSSEWEGATHNSNVDPYFTRAQLATVTAMRKYLLVYCPSVVIENEGVV